MLSLKRKVIIRGLCKEQLKIPKGDNQFTTASKLERWFQRENYQNIAKLYFTRLVKLAS